MVGVNTAQPLIFYQLKTSQNGLINYCYIVVDEKNKNAVLIDPAWEADKFENIIAYHRIEEISILLTHHHKDHIDLAGFFSEKYNSLIYMAATEIRYYDFFCKNLVPIESELPFSLGEITVAPIFTPGHTVGSTCYLINKRLYTGDTLFIEGCGVCSGRGGSPAAMFESLNRLKKIIALDDHIYPGHRYHAEPGQNFAYLLKVNIYLQLENKDHFINFRMREGQMGLFNFK